MEKTWMVIADEGRARILRSAAPVSILPTWKK